MFCNKATPECRTKYHCKHAGRHKKNIYCKGIKCDSKHCDASCIESTTDVSDGEELNQNAFYEAHQAIMDAFDLFNDDYTHFDFCDGDCKDCDFDEDDMHYGTWE